MDGWVMHWMGGAWMGTAWVGNAWMHGGVG